MADLQKQSLDFGRCAEDYSFEAYQNILKKTLLLSISKVHFRIKREKIGNSEHAVLIDLSSNGTFVNSTKVGRDKKCVLQPNDEIALSLQTNSVFLFVDTSGKSCSEFPESLTEKYTMTNRELGKGAMGRVYLAFEKDTCKKLAVKVIEMKRLSSGGMNVGGTQDLATTKREIEILQAVDHPNVVKVFDVFEAANKTYIVLEFIEGGELFDRIVDTRRNGQGLGEELTKLYGYQLLLALKYLHSKEITHRDLKPENVLLCQQEDECIAKVADFGLSKLVHEMTVMKTYCGTPTYVAPEVLLNSLNNDDRPYTSAVDLWSLGVILFTCLVGYPPFSEEYRDLHMNEQILKGRLIFTPALWSKRSAEAKDFIKRLITVPVPERMTVTEAFNHPWMQDEPMRRKVAKLWSNRGFGDLESEVLSPLRNARKRKTEPMEVDDEPEPNNGGPTASAVAARQNNNNKRRAPRR